MDVIEPQKRKSKGRRGGGKKSFISSFRLEQEGTHTLTAHFQKVASSLLASTASVEAINDLVKLFFEDPNDGWYNSEQNTNRMELFQKKI